MDDKADETPHVQDGRDDRWTRQMRAAVYIKTVNKAGGQLGCNPNQLRMERTTTYYRKDVWVRPCKRFS
jgi:hypothetical protein